MKKLLALLSVSYILILFSCTKDGFMSGSSSRPGPVSLTDISGANGGNSTPGDSSGLMTAGEWNDLDHWDFWKTLISRDTISSFPGIWGFYTQNKISVILKDNSGKLIHDAKLILSAGGSEFTAVTDNFGKAELFPGLNQASYSYSSFDLKAIYMGQEFNLGTINQNDSPVIKTIPVNKNISSNLDIMFVVDATGSMSDEIKYLKNELKNVISRASIQLPGILIRMASVFYRDHGDNYVIRPFNFTTDISQLTGFINNQNAEGGGDYPEAVDEALEAAVNQQLWSSHALNRLIFLVLDAPAHKSTEVLNRLKIVINNAQQKGIRIIPVSASGIDHETEFLFRFFSISTNSTYVFITNHSGIGNPHLTPTVGTYQVEFLNNLMVRLIAKYGKNVD